MRTLVVVVESGSGLRAKRATFCEIELRGIIHKTNEQKGAQCRWAQTFRLGEFVGTDGLTMRIKSMKTDRILAQAIIPLERFLSPGTYHESIPLSSEIFLSITLITERSGRQISRSSSVKFVGKTLQKLLKQQEAAEKKNLSLSESAIATLQTPAPANPPGQTNNQSVKVSAVCRPRRMRYRTEQPDREQTTRVNRYRKNSNSGSVVPDAEQGSSVVSDISELSEHNNDMDIDTQIVLKPLGETNHKLFGIPLDEVMENQHKIYQDMNLTVPYFFSEAGKIIRAEGLSVQGIFRIRGKIKDVKALKEKIDAGEEITPEEWQNIHLLTTLMKAFLRELPVPILNFENYEKFISIADLNNLDEKVAVLQSLVASLPENNYNVVTFLFSLLNELSQHPEKTQMNSENLAKVIAPNLIWKEFIDIMDMSAVQDTMKGNTVAQIMIDQFDLIFSR